jgi:uncharacterized membrane protein
MGELSVKRLKLELSTSRIEALTDGVFAIAMTLLVLNFEVPNPLEGKGVFELHHTLRQLWPNFLHYVMSFLLLSLFWIKNHQQYHFIKRSDQRLLWLNLTSLLFICLIPFTTSLVSDYGDMPIAAIIFELNLFAAGAAFYFQWHYATRDRQLVDPNLDARVIMIYRLSSLVTPLVSVAAIVVSIFHPRVGTGLYFLIPFILIYIKRGMISGALAQ